MCDPFFVGGLHIRIVAWREPLMLGEKQKMTLKEQGFYHRVAWRKARKLALQRDHYLCQECLRRGRIKPATEVHHIKELEDYPELGLELSNLESLCWRCHEATKHQPKKREEPEVRVIRATPPHPSEFLKR